MSNKRTPVRSYRPPISAEALALWRECCELERQGNEDALATVGKRLTIACGFDWPSMCWPTRVKCESPPLHIARSADDLAICWRDAWRMRLALIEADAAADREAEAAK
jgi:hypothetical protein